jgi:hypothetical protein
MTLSRSIEAECAVWGAVFRQQCGPRCNAILTLKTARIAHKWVPFDLEVSYQNYIEPTLSACNLS